MKDKMMKMLAKKRDLSPSQRQAKMDVVNQLRDIASGEMRDKMDGLKKVSVMSDSQEGLEHGLDKAKQVVSSDEMEQMKDHAENDMGDYKSALEEHSGDEDNQENGWVNDENRYADGGQVPATNPQLADALRKAFGKSEGGEIQESPDFGGEEAVEPSDENDNTEEESPDQGEYAAVDQESPADHEDEFHGLDMDELDEKLAKLMALKAKMESR